MKLLFDELVELYCRIHAACWEDEFHDDEYYDANSDAFGVVETAIVKLHAPATVGDVMLLPAEGSLRAEGLIYLIERDASHAYDQVEGYIDEAIDLIDSITPAQYGFNGLDLCEWIDRSTAGSAAARPPGSD